MDQNLLVVAIGGNALLRPHEKGTAQEQRINAAKTCKKLSCLLKPKYSLIISHGNGPQVGNIVLQNEMASSDIPPLTLDALVAQSEGSMGYYLQQGLLNTLRAKNIRRYVVTMITQVLVDKKDPAFKKPTKPIGRFYTEDQAKSLIKTKHWNMMEDAKRGWRRVVASPVPIRVLQRYMIRDLAQMGSIVIAVGGGGIPIIQNSNNRFEGIEAVIDKDLASATLATSVKADCLIILTAVPCVYLNFKTSKQKALRHLTSQELAKHVKKGHFAKGSMLPKIEAALAHLSYIGKKVIITDIENLPKAMQGKAGTHIYRSYGYGDEVTRKDMLFNA
ncbi:carbamate kinase [Elusimicrobiota bacterium]